MALVETHPTNSSVSNGTNRIEAPAWENLPARYNELDTTGLPTIRQTQMLPSWSGEITTLPRSAHQISLDPVIDRHGHQNAHRASLDACWSKHGMQDVGARRLVERGIGSRDDLQRGGFGAAEGVDDGLYRHASLQSGMPQRERVLERRREHDRRGFIDGGLRVDLIGSPPIPVPARRTRRIDLRHVPLESTGVEADELSRFPRRMYLEPQVRVGDELP